MAAKDPFVLVFATPAFCQTAICGPMLDGVKVLAADYPTFTFINVEPSGSTSWGRLTARSP